MLGYFACSVTFHGKKKKSKQFVTLKKNEVGLQRVLFLKIITTKYIYTVSSQSDLLKSSTPKYYKLL